MAGDAALGGPSVQETEPDAEQSKDKDEEPWRVFPDCDIQVPGDRLDERGNPVEGRGVFRVHYLDKSIAKPGDDSDAKKAGGDEEETHCYNDFKWGGIYRQVQNILSILRGLEMENWKMAGHHHKGDAPALAVERIPALPEMTLAMGAGNAWVPREAEEEEDAAQEEEGSQVVPKEEFEECAVVEPHDVADYLRENFSPACGPLRLMTFQTREGANLLSSRTSLLGKKSIYEVWERAPGTYEIGSPEAAAEAMRLREFLVSHMLAAQKPILIDDSVHSYLICGYREFDPDGPNELAPVQYRILDTQYGLRYAVRKYNFLFDKEKGQDQLGTDLKKDQWVPAEWVEEGRGVLNSYVPGPFWMVLLIGDYESSPQAIQAAQTAAEDAKHEAEEAARKEAQAKWLAEEEAAGLRAIEAARLAAEAEETGEIEDDALNPPG